MRLFSSVHYLILFALPLTISAQSYTVRLWDTRLFNGNEIVSEADQLTLYADDNEWTLDKLDILFIYRDDRRVTSDFLTRDQINGAAVRAIFGGLKEAIGERRISPPKPNRIVDVTLLSGEIRHGKIAKHDSSLIRLRSFFGHEEIELANVTRITQGFYDVSPTYLSEAQLLVLIDSLEEAEEGPQAVPAHALSARAMVLSITVLTFVGVLYFISNTIMFDFG